MFLLCLLDINFTANMSDSSTPEGIYRVHHIDKPHQGDLVYLRMPIKQIWALPGDHVKFSPEGVYREGVLIPNSAPQVGIPHVCPFGNYIVPPDMFVGMGTRDIDSWDSRFVCFLPQSIIRGTVTPVWTK